MLVSQDDVRSVLAARDDVTSSQVGALHSNLEGKGLHMIWLC